MLGYEAGFEGGRWRVEDVDGQAHNEDDDSRITGGLAAAIEDLVVRVLVVGSSCYGRRIAADSVGNGWLQSRGCRKSEKASYERGIWVRTVSG